MKPGYRTINRQLRISRCLLKIARIAMSIAFDRFWCSLFEAIIASVRAGGDLFSMTLHKCLSYTRCHSLRLIWGMHSIKGFKKNKHCEDSSILDVGEISYLNLKNGLGMRLFRQ